MPLKMYTFVLYKKVGFTKDDRVALVNATATSLKMKDYLNTLGILDVSTSSSPRLNYSAGHLTLNLQLMEADSLARKGAYMMIVESDKNGKETNVTFWFVDSVERLANQVARLSLTLDVLNTFLPQFESSTYVNREHRNRWQSFALKNTGSTTIAGLTLIPYVDPIGEGFNVNKYVTKKEEVPGDGNHWYLTYKTEKEPSETGSNPVTCWLVPEAPVKSGDGSFLTEESAAGRLGIGNSYPRSTYLVTSDGNPWAVYGGDEVGVLYKSTDYAMAELYRASSASGVAVTLWRKNAGGWASETVNTSLGLFAIDGKVRYGTGADKHGLNPHQLGGLSNGKLSTGGYYSHSIANVDRTQSTLVKIIECPYCPTAPTISDKGTISFAGWTYDPTVSFWRLDDLGASLFNEVAEVEIPGVQWGITKDITAYMPAFLEDPKLLNSDYHAFSAVYDSFVQSFPLDGFQGGDASKPSDLMKISYKQSSAISSALAFEFKPEEITLKLSGAFDSFLVSNRSNEKIIYTNNYLNYLRNGFNYDVKNKNVTISSAWGGFAGSLAITLATLLSAFATGGATAPLAISAGVSTAASFANAIKATASAENSLSEKKKSLQNQAASVAGANDLDLLRFYSNNKLYLVTMDPSEEMRGMLDTYFRYYGYAVNRQKVPNISGRAIFNFLQCTPKYTSETRAAFGSDDIEALYTQALAEGVTYINADALKEAGALNLNKDLLDAARGFENFEVDLFEKIKEFKHGKISD